MTKGDLYFILNPALGIIKIGIAGDVRQRLSGLECSCGVPLELLRVARGAEDMEEPLHDIFGASRLMGEWFSPTPELVALAMGSENVFEYVKAHESGRAIGRAARDAEIARRKAAQEEACREEREAAEQLRLEAKRVKAARDAKLKAANDKREQRRRQIEQETRERVEVERRAWAEKSATFTPPVLKPDAVAVTRQRQAAFNEQRARNAALLGTLAVDPTATKRNGPAGEGEAVGVN